MSEHDLKAAVHAYLVRLVRAGAPLWFFKVHGGPYQRTGVPDFLLCVAGRFAAIELKDPDEPHPTPAPRQVRELRAIQRARGEVRVLQSLAATETFVATLLTAAQQQPVVPVLPASPLSPDPAV